MSSSYKGCFPPEILSQFNAKYHVTTNLLVSNDNVAFVSLNQSKGWSYILHLLLDYIPPKNVPILFVNSNGVSYGLRNIVAVLMSLLPVFAGCLGYDTVPFLQGVFSPLHKGWLFESLVF